MQFTELKTKSAGTSAAAMRRLDDKFLLLLFQHCCFQLQYRIIGREMKNIPVLHFRHEPQ
jgi:hypothetical protein